MTAVRQKDAPQVALVTGGARRLGRAIALALAADGWDLAIHYGSSGTHADATVAEIQALGRRAVALQCGLEDAVATGALVGRAIAALGPVGCVVNNASLFEFDNAASFGADSLERHMRTNLTAPILLAQALHAATAAGSQAVVVNLLDQKLYNLNPDFLSYTLSKAGLQAATTMLAQALAPAVRVVGVAPGLTMISHLQTEEEFEQAHRLSPLGASSTPEDIVSGVLFAIKNRAITGSTLLIDGGQHLVPLSRDFSFIKGK
jgi:NAD(P)-dependent dehydrogenase (short-subunit alcohol dehydrogenase family)